MRVDPPGQSGQASFDEAEASEPETALEVQQDHDIVLVSAPEKVANPAADSASSHSPRNAEAEAAARVARIRAALLSGNYRVNLDKLAENILQRAMKRNGTSDHDL